MKKVKENQGESELRRRAEEKLKETTDAGAGDAGSALSSTARLYTE